MGQCSPKTTAPNKTTTNHPEVRIISSERKEIKTKAKAKAKTEGGRNEKAFRSKKTAADR